MKHLRNILDVKSILDAVSDSQAVIKFSESGDVIDANDNFCKAMGYELDEIRGRHHRMFVTAAEGADPGYQLFWNDLRAGRFRSGEFERIAKGGRIVTIQATYSPIRDRSGRVVGVVKVANEVPSRKAVEQRNALLVETLDRLPVPIMTCDPKTFVIDYANEASIQMLKRIAAYISVRPEEIVGQKIDIFHKNPSHQHRMLGALGRDGHQTTIKVGAEFLELKISIISGRPLLVWYVVTHRVAVAEGMEATVRSMGEVADRASEASVKLSDLVAETVRRAGDVAATVNQQAMAIGEVAQRTTETATRATQVDNAARAAQDQIRGLVGAVDGISAVVATVSSIAEQTKLLALNATIEAARAGAAGRGFAVVASEVKALSDQTARSTDDISRRIAEIQTETERTTRSVSEVITGINQIVELINAVAGATEEQRATAREVSETVRQVAGFATDTGRAAESVAGIAEDVQSTAQELSRRLQEFNMKD